LSVIYEIIVRARAALYRREIFKVERLTGAIVISIGNLTTGGTGKTPLVALVARLVAQELRAFPDAKLHDNSAASRICILSRGYGRSEAHRRVVVSDGRQLLADAATGGDEPRELAERLQTIAAVISDRDRAAAARWAQQHLGTRVLLLDDGFQHLPLARDMDIVTVDATQPFGGGHLLPRGRLREPLTALRRANLIVITRAEQVAAETTRQLAKALRNLCSEETPVIVCRTQITNALPLHQQHHTRDQSLTLTTSVLAFCALGNPESFFTLLRQNDYQLMQTIAFRDHHNYRQQDAANIEHAARECGARVLITTAKDAVKLRELSWTLAVYVIELML
jgi:tetraacyldisaccharide 4'-kinase